jgi:hypothetical protein
MTWIRTIPLPEAPLSEADAKLRQAMEAQNSLYPIEYATPVHPAEGGGAAGWAVRHQKFRSSCLPPATSSWVS